MTRPSPSPGLVERMTAAIKAVKAQRHAPITGDEELEARAALAASDRDVLTDENARLREALKTVLRKLETYNVEVDGMPQELWEAYKVVREVLNREEDDVHSASSR